MKNQTIKNLMVPLSEYATVPVDATLLDAVVALEKAQAAFDRTKYRHRAVLVLDKDNQVVGKISQLYALKALEPKYQEIQDPVTSGAYRHFSKRLLRSILEQYRLFDQPLKDVPKKAARLKVRDFMYSPTEGEYLSENATLDEAIHMLVMGHHQSLLVTRSRRIVGILRLTDVFTAVFHSLKQDALERNTNLMNDFRVLIVDDEEQFLDVMVKRLKKRGLHVFTAKNGLEAIVKIKETDVDVVVLDVRMPEMGGIETLKHIKMISPSTEVIVLTGHASLEIAVEGMEIGAFDYLMKPVNIDELFYRMQDAFKKKHYNNK